MNNPELMKETNFTSLIFLKHDPKDAAMLLEDKRYHIEEYKIFPTKIFMNKICFPRILFLYSNSAKKFGAKKEVR